MKISRISFGLLFSLVPVSAQASNVEFRLVVECAPGLAQYSPIFSDNKIICVAPDTIMTGANIILARAVHSKFSDNKVDLTFDRNAQIRVSEVTENHVGGQIAMLSDGKLITAAVIMEPIRGGTIEFDFPPKDRDAILRQFQDRTLVK